MIPNTFHPTEKFTARGMAATGAGFDEERFLHVPLPGQHQDPRVNPQPGKFVERGLLHFLTKKHTNSSHLLHTTQTLPQYPSASPPPHASSPRQLYRFPSAPWPGGTYSSDHGAASRRTSRRLRLPSRPLPGGIRFDFLLRTESESSRYLDVDFWERARGPAGDLQRHVPHGVPGHDVGVVVKAYQQGAEDGGNFERLA